MAERPALNWVAEWIVGLPTALLSLQSAVLSIGRAIRAGTANCIDVQQTMQALMGVREILKPGPTILLPALREQAVSLSRLHDHFNEPQLNEATKTEASRRVSVSESAIPAAKEIVSSLEYVLASVEAMLVLEEPKVTTLNYYPAPRFFVPRGRATINLLRTIAGMLVGFVIWDVTAWTEGPLFMANVAVALVIFVSLDDPVAGNRINLLGTAAGGVAAIAAKFMLMPWSNDPLWLAFVLFLLLFFAVFAETKAKYASLGIFYINAVLVLLEPTNPQQYDLSLALNSLVALIAAYAFVPLVFMAIGTPKIGAERVDNLLNQMQIRLRAIKTNPPLVRAQQLTWETEMYDAMQQLAASTNDPHDRARAVDYLLAGRQACGLVAAPSLTAIVLG